MGHGWFKILNLDDFKDDDNDDDAVESLLSGSTNLCDECAVSRSRQPICLPNLCSTIPIGFSYQLFVSIENSLFQLPLIGYCWFLFVSNNDC